MNTSVTFNGYSFPPNLTLTVTIAPYGTYGLGGVTVGTTQTDGNGNFSATYTVPAQYSGSSRLSIRWQGPNNYAMWDYWNNQ